jgi:hypothetical protein
MKRKSKFLNRFSQLKKLIQENKQLYTIYSNTDTDEHIKIVSTQTITDDMNSKSLINVTLENGVETELRYWEITPYTQKEFNQ